ncbi:MAG: alpha/beta hydrolase [Deltaproteobacteria bacterium]|nr:alpha/beta hydrolase [Candidatus Zymogenaceae bacterium]
MQANRLNRRWFSLSTAFLIAALILTAACDYTPEIVGADGKVPEKSITKMEKVTLGGLDQWIVIRGVDVKNPVLLFIHGGPGKPSMPMVIKYNGNLESDFVVVTWDQRGAGKSYSVDIPPESMTLEQLISDAHELVGYLKERFNADKIYIVGHSCGSVIGMNLVDRYPEDFYAFVGVGQLVNGARNEIISYEYTVRMAEETDNEKALEELRKIGPPADGLYKNNYDNLLVQRKWLLKFGGITYGKTNYFDMYMDYLFNEEYTIFESLNIKKGLKFSLTNIWPDEVRTDLFTQIPKVDIPVYFAVGRHDWNTPFEITEEYFNILKAPKKELVWFENSGHSPCYEEPDKFNLLIERVKTETYKQ